MGLRDELRSPNFVRQDLSASTAPVPFVSARLPAALGLPSTMLGNFDIAQAIQPIHSGAADHYLFDLLYQKP